MSSRQRLIPGTFALAVLLIAAACSDVGGLNGLGPSGLVTSGAGGVRALGGERPEYANVMNQGGGSVYAANGAMLVRQLNGLRASITVPTPPPGSYVYPAGRVSGHPEVFTLWAFVFNYPDLCSAPCDMNDLGNTPAKGGVYNVGGHVASGEVATIAGQIGVGETPYNPAHSPLESPSTAEVHLAIAPHGHVDPSAYPNEFRTPAGSPPLWWIAMFH